MSTEVDARYLPTGEATRRLGIHAETLRRWARNGVIDYAVTTSGRLHFDVEGYLAKAGEVGQQGPRK